VAKANACSDGERLHKQVSFDGRSFYTNNTLISTSSCLLVNSCFVSFALAIEALVARKRLLSTDLSTWKILAASEILGLLELFRNAITLSIGTMVAKGLSAKVVLFMAVEVCLTELATIKARCLVTGGYWMVSGT
jgi:hypothetical protein